MYWFQCVCLLAVVSDVFGRAISRLAELPQGPVRGYRSRENEDIFVFYNIPYATVPTGDDKFKAPLPPPTWNTTLHAHNRGVSCPQTTTQPHPFRRTEDCLVVNIHVPDTTETNLPVIVIIHESAFLSGRSHMKSPSFLVETKKVIAITFNYRMGANGFLCLGTDFAPGNAGLKDQVALLEWVRRNIHYFGGDSDNVTVGGCMNGVELLVLSNSTDGLFHKVITDTQCSLSSVEYDPMQTAFDAASRFNFPNANIAPMTDLEEFFSIYASILSNEFINGLGEFKACVEKTKEGQKHFLTDAPINILRSGNFKKLPTLYSYSKDVYRWRSFSVDIEEMRNSSFHKFLPNDLDFENDEQRVLVAERVKNFYFAADDSEEAYRTYFTDLIAHKLLRTVSLQVNASNDKIYLSEFSFPDEDPSAESPLAQNGAYLCDQFTTAVGNVGVNPPAEREALAKVLRDIYVNFITEGNPTPETNSSLPTWLPVNNVDRSPHYSIGKNITLKGAPLADRAVFWDTIYQENKIRVPAPPSAASAINNKVWLTCVLAVFLAIKSG